MSKLKVAIVGGGASGVFASLQAAAQAKQNNLPIEIKVFEASQSFLKKVRISGGGRCNVTHHEFEPKRFVQNYPRGQRELISPMQSFQAKDMVHWLSERGVRIKHEADGRMFPVTDKSETVIECFLKEAERLKVELIKNQPVKEVVKTDQKQFQVKFAVDEYLADKLLIATGSMAIGHRLAKQLGHHITELAPSLFTFKIKDIILNDLAGTSFQNAELKLKIEGSKSFKQQGPLLITHWGLSGPALLKLSAWAAREMQSCKYQAKIIVNWLSLGKHDDAQKLVQSFVDRNPKALVTNIYPEELTKRFWLQLLEKSEVSTDKRWNEVSKKELNKIIQNLFACELSITGKSRFKEEFVECGGVDLKEVDFKTMQSKLVPGLYFSGEVLDIDGITGGFNFQNAWTTAYIAASHMVKK